MIYMLLFFAGVLAWLISTVAAGGGATILIPIVGFVLGVELVAPIITLASIIANPGRVWLFRRYIDWPTLYFLVPGTIVGSVFGAWTLAISEPYFLQRLLAIFLLIYVAASLKHISLPFIRISKRVLFPLGMFVSYLSGLIGATGPILNPFLLRYGLEKEKLVATKSVNSLVMQLCKLTTYSLFGLLNLNTFVFGICIGVGGVMGILIARKHLLSIDASRFRKYTLSMIAISGVLMLYKSFA